MTAYRFTTHPHIGDNIICTAAVRNVRLAHPEITFARPETCPEAWRNNPDFTDTAEAADIGKITYGRLADEQRGRRGTVVEGFTKSLCEMLGLKKVPIYVKRPVLYLDADELEEAERWRGCILLNANCQRCSVSKGYPYWQQVVDGLPGERIIQVGGNEGRDISPTLRGVVDWRGRSTLRQLMAMVYGCKCVLSPPSGISNIAGAFGRRQVIVNASREPDILLRYENATHISHRCEACGWGVRTGCVACNFNSGRGCPHPVKINGSVWCRCQAETPAEAIIQAAKGI